LESALALGFFFGGVEGAAFLLGAVPTPFPVVFKAFFKILFPLLLR
jgi:hypothetical protein